MSNFQFISTRNYMKRHSSSGSATMLGPDTSRYFGSFFTRDYEVVHSLGYAPIFRAFYEPFQDGRLFEAFQDTQYYFSNPINTYGGTEDAPTVLVWADTHKLYIRLFFTFNTLSGVSFPIHWVIYQDYGML